MHLRFALAPALVLALAAQAGAVNVVIDYSYDSYNFFGAGNPDGPAAGEKARAALDEVARYYSEILLDTFSEIRTPNPLASSAFNGVATWAWDMTFTHPATGGSVTLSDQVIAADEYRIYAGGRSIAGTTLGIGGPGGYGWSQGGNGGFFTSAEVDQINAISDSFSQAVESRGEPAGQFAAWGGSVTFDSDSSADWHWDWTTDVGTFKDDFYSVVIHEVGHALGLGTASEWYALISGGSFLGSNAYAANGNSYPAAIGGHWGYGVDSTILGTSITQEASLDPDVTSGTRKYLTALDAAAMQDIGWEVATIAPPMGGDPLLGDYNNDGLVDAADYTVWRDNVGQPAGTLPNDATGAAVGSGQYLLWRDNYGTSAGLSPSAAPEPSAATFAGLLLATLLRTRRVTQPRSRRA
ncbi:hypothetical protein KOR34_17770 [Posidoniimonas corsicana]|uniref:Matrixin n=1 Tax=Posidoniimonas corsicana TaxID=1938618 RepID=A0A5C5VGQ9_9BACT|nr:hypothetical protein [Posidoniimonas corsicana]TWT36832.1 hypothetical protein KOR34_17770 [Posidoniimonas corsicana]